MAMTDIEKFLSVFAGISAGDVDLATQYIDDKRLCSTIRMRPPVWKG